MHKPSRTDRPKTHVAADDPNESPKPQVSYVEAGEGDGGQRIDNFLIRVIKDAPRSLIYRILRSGEVRVNSKRIGPDYRLVAGDRVRLPPIKTKPRSSEAPSQSLKDFIGDSIIYED